MNLATLEQLLTKNLRNPDEAIPAVLVDQFKVNRMQVYRGNVMGAQLLSLETIFPICQRILGEAFFGQMMRAYVLEHPMRGPQLDDAETFPIWLFQHIKNNPILDDYHYLPDLAQLELAEHHAWYADDAPAFDFNAFAQTSETYTPDQIVLCLAPSVSLLKSPWPIDRLWLAQQQETPPQIDAEDNTIHLLIARQGAAVTHQRLSVSEFQLLESVKQAAPFSQLSTDHNPTEMPKMIQIGAISHFFVDKLNL